METISSSFSLPSSRNIQDTAQREVWLALVIFPKAKWKRKKRKSNSGPEDSLILKNSWISWHIATTSCLSRVLSLNADFCPVPTRRREVAPALCRALPQALWFPLPAEAVCRSSLFWPVLVQRTYKHNTSCKSQIHDMLQTDILKNGKQWASHNYLTPALCNAASYDAC